MLVAPELRGRTYAEAHSDATDQWFRQVYVDALGDSPGLALAAVGGYGRGELSPYSDVDVILIHDDLDDYADAAEALWYPVWDHGLKMGYAVVDIDQAEVLARQELHWATAFQTARLIAGDHRLLIRLEDVTSKVWADTDVDLMGRLAEAVRSRHLRYGDVAFQIEPHLKEGRGGLRDLHALASAGHADVGFGNSTLSQLRLDGDALLEARVELHRVSGRADDILSLETQDDVALALGDRSGTDLMVRLALAARRIAWHSDEAWFRWERVTGRAAPCGPLLNLYSKDFDLADGHLELGEGGDLADDPLAVLRLAAAAAHSGRTIGRGSLGRIRDEGAPLPEPWPVEARRLFAEILLAGRAAISIIEDLDQFDLMTRLIPEWEAVRCRPQRNVMHTYTVDRHLCETAANAAKLADTVLRPDLLVVGALFHDIGKGYPGDHTEMGMELITTMATRMGYPDDEVGVLVDLCRHHLLLPDVATRRDLSDPGTISAVAAAVDSVEFIDLLAALTEADSIATGPSAWGSWKAGLLKDLVGRTTFVLEGGAPAELAVSEFPSPEILELMANGEQILRGEGTALIVVAPDQPALFSQMAGVLVVSGLDVLDALAYSDADGMVACHFTVQPSTTGAVDWERVTDTAARALEGRVALTARVRRRAQNFERFRRRLSAAPPRHDVVIDNEISDVATVVEVHAADSLGLLFWITQAMAELRLNIRSAKVQTFGPQAVDSFYICDAAGGKLADPELLHELDLAIRQAVGQEMT